MPRAGHNHSNQRGTRKQPSTARRRKLDKDFNKAMQFGRDKMRWGSPYEILNANNQEEDDYSDNGPTMEENATDILLPSDSEISQEDDDDFLSHEDIPTETQYINSGPDDEYSEDRFFNKIPISVIEDRAVFQVPDWALGFADNDLDLRWETYSKIADWLTRERPLFLQNPSYLNLAGNSINQTPPIPVAQDGLHKILGLRCDISTFSKHARHGIIVWPNREFPAEQLWSQEAKLAWFAQAIRQRQTSVKYMPRNSLLDDRTIHPSSKASVQYRRELERKVKTTAVNPVEYVQYLCILTGCAWKNVLDRYSDHIFYQEK